MPFEKILKDFIHDAITNYNNQSYDKLSEIICDNIEFISPEVNLPLIQAPAVYFTNKEDVLSFWEELDKKFTVKISRVENIQIGKHSIVRCHYDELNMINEIGVYIDSYQKVYKITNTIIQ